MRIHRINGKRKVKAAILASAAIGFVCLLTAYYTKCIKRVPSVNRDEERRIFVNRIINGRNIDCLNQVRMSKECFHKLCSILRETTGVRDSLNINVEEQVVMFLHTLGHNVRNRVISFRFSRSGETVSRYFNNVLQAVLSLYKDLVRQPVGIETPPEIRNDRRFWPYFKNCVGAIDGTHIKCSVPIEDQARFRGRKLYTTQNVMAACSFDLKFTYILAGWEGSAADPVVLADALKKKNKLLVPEGKYYLVDAGYGNRPGFLAPYRGTRYHLNEYSGRIPESQIELFNHRHSSLRNCIERSFGVLKKQFPILDSTPHFSFANQVKVVVACCVIHNYIIGVEPNDQFMQEIDQELQTQQLGSSMTQREQRDEHSRWSSTRDEMAATMYADFRRGRRN